MDTITKENHRALYAWPTVFLGYYIPYFVRLANKKAVNLWPLLSEVDMLEDPIARINKMESILNYLIK